MSKDILSQLWEIEVLMACGGQSPGRPLNIIQCTYSVPQIIIWQKMLMVVRLRNCYRRFQWPYKGSQAETPEKGRNILFLR